jgi:hypothetical protein
MPSFFEKHFGFYALLSLVSNAQAFFLTPLNCNCSMYRLPKKALKKKVFYASIAADAACYYILQSAYPLHTVGKKLLF